MDKDKKCIEELPCDLQELIISYLPDSDIYKVIRCCKNLYDIGLDYYRNLFFHNDYHIMKLAKRKEGLYKIKEDYAKSRHNFIKEYGNAKTRQVKIVPSNVKIDPFAEDPLKDLHVLKVEALDHKAVHSLHSGGFANAALCCNGEAIVTTDHVLDFGFFDVLKDGTNPIPKEHCVLQIECASSDIVYIAAKNKNEHCGQVYTIKRRLDNTLCKPEEIELPAQAKYVSGALAHQFAVTVDNEVYAWLPHSEGKPFKLKGLMDDDNEYDEEGKIIEKPKTAKAEHTPEDELKKKLEHEKAEEEQKQAEIDRKNKSICKIVSGNTFTMILYSSGELFWCNFKEDTTCRIVCKRVKELAKKNIVDIEAGFTHCVALEKDKIKPITHWNPQETSEWFKRIGFHECGNLADNHNINGETIANADEVYYEDTLGIFENSLKQKLRYEINKVRQTTYENINLYGWGSNTSGQLGIIDKSTHIPKRIPLPELTYKDDYIVGLKCGRRNTAILTKLGEVWIVGNCRQDLNKKVNKELDNASDSEDDEEAKGDKKSKKEVQKGGKKNKHVGKKLHGHKNKKTEIHEDFSKYREQLEENNEVKKHHKQTRHNKHKMIKQQEKVREEKKKVYDLEKSIDHRFANFTDVFTKNDANIPYKVENIMLGVMNFAAVISIRSEPLPKKVKGEKDKNKKVKLQPIEKILDKLENSLKYKVEDFTVVYKDRFAGDIEGDLIYFLESSDIPSHRIQRLLKNGEVIWDKKEKIDKFKFY